MIEFVVGDCATIGRQVRMPLVAFSIMPLGAVSRLNVSVSGGAFGSLAVFVTVSVWPAISDWLAMGLNTGADRSKVRLSNVAALARALLCAVTASPQSAVLAKPVRFELPNVVQLVPLTEVCAVKVVPLRASRNQYGAVKPIVVELKDAPPVLGRFWKLTPLFGVMQTKTFLAPAAALSRTMTPA